MYHNGDDPAPSLESTHRLILQVSSNMLTLHTQLAQSAMDVGKLLENSRQSDGNEQTLTEQLSEATIELGKLQSEYAKLQTALTRKESDCAYWEKKFKDAEVDTEGALEEAIEVRVQLDHSRAELAKQVAEIQRLEQAYATESAEKEVLRRELEEQGVDLGALPPVSVVVSSEREKSLEMEVRRLRQENDRLLSENERLKRANSLFHAPGNDRQAMPQDIDAMLTKLKDSLAAMEAQKNALEGSSQQQQQSQFRQTTHSQQQQQHESHDVLSPEQVFSNSPKPSLPGPLSRGSTPRLNVLASAGAQSTTTGRALPSSSSRGRTEQTDSTSSPTSPRRTATSPSSTSRTGVSPVRTPSARVSPTRLAPSMRSPRSRPLVSQPGPSEKEASTPERYVLKGGVPRQSVFATTTDSAADQPDSPRKEAKIIEMTLFKNVRPASADTSSGRVPLSHRTPISRR